MRRGVVADAIKAMAAVAVLGIASGRLPALADDGAGAASRDAMQNMPRLQEKRTITVTGDENWDEVTGFGKEAGMAEMMTLMMVGGSGMEHMKMGSMKMGNRGMADMKMGGVTNQNGGWQVLLNIKPDTLKIGKNILDVTVLDSGGKPVRGAKVTGAVEMTSMDMGVTRPTAREGKDGHYMTEVDFSMRGPWRVTVTVAPPRQKPFVKAFDFNISP
jgi:hypothetical protein